MCERFYGYKWKRAVVVVVAAVPHLVEDGVDAAYKNCSGVGEWMSSSLERLSR